MTLTVYDLRGNDSGSVFSVLYAISEGKKDKNIKKIVLFLSASFRFNSSPELEAQVSFSDHLLSVVRPSVHPSIFTTFSRTIELISTKLGTKHTWEMRIHFFFQMKGQRPFSRGGNNKKAQIHGRNLKIFFN